MTKLFSSVITVEFAYNHRVAESKEEYIELLKQEYLAKHDIELEDHEINEITEKRLCLKYQEDFVLNSKLIQRN